MSFSDVFPNLSATLSFKKEKEEAARLLKVVGRVKLRIKEVRPKRAFILV